MGWWLGQRAAAETHRTSFKSLEILAFMGKSCRRGIFSEAGGSVEDGWSGNGVWVWMGCKQPAMRHTPWNWSLEGWTMRPTLVDMDRKVHAAVSDVTARKCRSATNMTRSQAGQAGADDALGRLKPLTREGVPLVASLSCAETGAQGLRW